MESGIVGQLVLMRGQERTRRAKDYVVRAGAGRGPHQHGAIQYSRVVPSVTIASQVVMGHLFAGGIMGGICVPGLCELACDGSSDAGQPARMQTQAQVPGCRRPATYRAVRC